MIFFSFPFSLIEWSLLKEFINLVQEKKFENYIIRCAVRDPENMSKIEPLKKFFTPEQFARLEMFKVDLLEHASIDKAVEGC